MTRIILTRQQYRYLRTIDKTIRGNWNNYRNEIYVDYQAFDEEGNFIGDNILNIKNILIYKLSVLQSLPEGKRKPHELLIVKNLYLKFTEL